MSGDEWSGGERRGEERTYVWSSGCCEEGKGEKKGFSVISDGNYTSGQSVVVDSRGNASTVEILV